MLAHQLGEHVVHLVGGRGVELARRLVGQEDRRGMRQGGAQCDPLLLAAGELTRAPRALLGEADAFEQFVGAPQALGARCAPEPELHGDQIARGELGRERARVVLVGVAEERGPVACEPACRQLADVLAVHAHKPGGRPLEACEQSQQRRLARPARTEHGQHLAVGHPQRQALQCGSVSFRRRVDPEHILQLDRGGGHVAASAARSGARPRRLVAAPTSSTARAT